MYRRSSFLASALLLAACADSDRARPEESDERDAQTEVVVRTLDGGYTPPRASDAGDAGADAGDAEVVPTLDAAAVEAAVDATVTAPVDATMPPVDANSEPPKPCDLGGKWALELRGNVSSGTTQFTNSSGEARAWALLDVSGSNGSFSANVRVCGANFPSIALRPEFGAESFTMQFPRGGAGLASGSFALRSTANEVQLDAFALLFGVKTSLKWNDGWPDNGDGVETDSDLDQKAGVTVGWSTNDGQKQPPVDIDKTQRARDSQLAARVVVAASKLNGCDSWNGTTGAVRMESHVLGCTLASGGGCNEQQIGILEIIRPQYSADRTTLEAVRLATDANCDRVLEALD